MTPVLRGYGSAEDQSPCGDRFLAYVNMLVNLITVTKERKDTFWLMVSDCGQTCSIAVGLC